MTPLPRSTSFDDPKRADQFIETADVKHELDMSEEPHAADRFGTETHRSAEEVALVRKLDFRIMPMLFAMYYMNYLDRAAIAQARLNGLEKHLGLKGSQYNVCISILFVGYTVAQLPSNMLMSSKKVRPSLWMCGWMMAWAVVSACTATAKNYHGMLACRIVLGLVEAPFYPGAIYLLSLFYTRREIATRIGLLYSANIVAIATSGLIAAATFATLSGKHGLHGWQYLFIIEGSVTFVVAFVGLFLLPDHPATTWWLSAEERILAQARMDRDTVGLQESRGAIDGLKQAVSDGKMWLLCLMQTLHLCSCGFNSFFPTVVGALGFNSTITLVLCCPPYLTAGAVAIALGYSSGKFNERTIHISAAMLLAIAGFAISTVTLNVAARYTSTFMFTWGAYAANSIILGWVSATCGQTQEKKAASLAIVNMFANASFIYTPFLYPASDGPKYATANTANACFAAGTLICAWALRAWLQATNRKMRREDPETSLLFAY